jgi:hypothetical protein
MPRGPTANRIRHQYKKAAMLVYAIAASTGLRGNVGKLRPAGRGQSDQRAREKTVFSGFHFFSSISVERYTLMAVRKDLPNRNAERDTLMLDHFTKSNRIAACAFFRDSPVCDLA